jgi:hypothetical protein
VPVKEDETSDSEEELFEDLDDMEVGQVPSKAPGEAKTKEKSTPGEKPPKAPKESKDEDEEEDEEHPKIGKALLIVGILLCIAGLIGVIGLRTNVIQHILGDPHPYPGIGYVEPWGHIVSMIPFVLGFLFMLAWGIKNDPIYYEMQKRKEEEKEEEEDLKLVPMPIDQTNVPKEFSKPLGGAEENAPEAPGQVQPPLTIEAEIEEEMAAKCEKMVAAANIFPEDRERLRSIIATNITYQDFVHEITNAIRRKKKEEKKLSAKEKTALLREERTEREGEPGAPAPTAEKERILSCEKMLAAANILPDERERLKLLIPSGISTHDLSEEIKKIIEKKKKKEKEKKLSADEKAAMLEEELAAELAELESVLGKEGDKDREMEEKILKEIEDLEKF